MFYHSKQTKCTSINAKVEPTKGFKSFQKKFSLQKQTQKLIYWKFRLYISFSMHCVLFDIFFYTLYSSQYSFRKNIHANTLSLHSTILQGILTSAGAQYNQLIALNDLKRKLLVSTWVSRFFRKFCHQRSF